MGTCVRSSMGRVMGSRRQQGISRAGSVIKYGIKRGKHGGQCLCLTKCVASAVAWLGYEVPNRVGFPQDKDVGRLRIFVSEEVEQIVS